MRQKLERLLLGILALGVLLAPQTSQINSYVNGQVLTADQLNAEFGNIYSTINGLDEDNFLPTTVLPATFLSPLAAGDGLAVNLGTGVMSVGVDNTGIEISADALRLKALGVTSAKLANGAVTTAKLADGEVTTAKLATTVKVAGADGDVTTPAYSFSADTNTGMYREGTDTIGFTTGGVKAASISPNYIAVTGSYVFESDSDTGVYQTGADTVSFATGGSNRANITSSGLSTVAGIEAGTGNGFFKVKIVNCGSTSGTSGTVSAAHGLTLSNIVGVYGSIRSATVLQGPGEGIVRGLANTTDVIVTFSGAPSDTYTGFAVIVYQ